MIKNLTYIGISITVAFIATVSSVMAGDVHIVRGVCSTSSHTAEGAIGSDLTKRQSRFFCNLAVIAVFDNNAQHVMVQFTQKEAHQVRILGFAGLMGAGGQMMAINNLYIDAGKEPIPVTEGVCKFFFKGKNMSGIMCGAKVDEGARRMTAIVAFDAAPGQ